MDLAFVKIDDIRDELTGRAAGTTDAQNYQRVFPRPMPAGHVLVHAWSTDAKGVEHLSIKCVPIAQADASKPLPSALRLEELLRMSDGDLLDLAPRVGIVDGGKTMGNKGGKRVLAGKIAEKEQEKKA